MTQRRAFGEGHPAHPTSFERSSPNLLAPVALTWCATRTIVGVTA
ncbi:hypothetical protein ACTMUQ_28930 [Streptomyces sp. SD11]